ncbi:MAG: NADH-quinone oxidoreductase subunit C, partial [bacterium]
KENKVYIAIKTTIPREGAEMGSITSLWRGADWLERELYDMFGIKFNDHPDLRRILMWDGYEGYPLRKDFTSPEIIKLPEVK